MSEKPNMRQMTMKKDDLIAVLQDNLDNHTTTFNEAQVAYRETVVDELDKMLLDAKRGNKIKRALSCPIPENHSGDYESAIKMLEMSIDSHIEITAEDFNQLVMDDWGWKERWKTTTSSYV